MRFSFILCTLNRPQLAICAAKSIINQDYQNFEIIVVDQSDEHNHELEHLDNRIIYFKVKEKGLSKARNFAIPHITGDYVCLLDDDAEYKKDTLTKAKTAIENDKVDIIVGCAMDKSGSKNLKILGNNDFEIIAKTVCSTVMSPSMIISSKFYKEIGFDETLGVGCKWGAGEEADFALQCLYRGANIKYYRSVEMTHPCADDMQNMKRSYSYNLGFGALHCKHLKEYKNQYMRYLVAKSIFRKAGAMILFSVSLKREKAKYYYYGLKGYLEGYCQKKQFYKKRGKV